MSERELKLIQKQINFIVYFFGTIGSLLLGLGLYAKFELNGNLVSAEIDTAMIVIGGLLLAYTYKKIIPLFKQSAEIRKRGNL